ncbi:hypothetical protein R3P38DRAFT_3496754 [Favolaschia claudopus]|uniref:Uncharacterized protein n=1 Tax=Favolaschia claudopus TaxID=2862362 RepID=A0AAW0C540_9AGAR
MSISAPANNALPPTPSSSSAAPPPVTSPPNGPMTTALLTCQAATWIIADNDQATTPRFDGARGNPSTHTHLFKLVSVRSSSQRARQSDMGSRKHETAYVLHDPCAALVLTRSLQLLTRRGPTPTPLSDSSPPPTRVMPTIHRWPPEFTTPPDVHTALRFSSIISPQLSLCHQRWIATFANSPNFLASTILATRFSPFPTCIRQPAGIERCVERRSASPMNVARLVVGELPLLLHEHPINLKVPAVVPRALCCLTFSTDSSITIWLVRVDITFTKHLWTLARLRCHTILICTSTILTFSILKQLQIPFAFAPNCLFASSTSAACVCFTGIYENCIVTAKLSFQRRTASLDLI